MRSFFVKTSVLFCCLFSALSVAAEEIQVAKVYRDYPGYINPALCENPNLDKAVPAPSPAAVDISPAAPAGEVSPVRSVPPSTQECCSSAPYSMRTDDPVGLYLTVWGGGVATHDLDIANHSDVSLDNGYGLGVAAGHDFGPVRIEIEGSFRDSNVDKIKSRNSEAGWDEDFEITAVMVNGYVDFKTGGNVTPYLGAGIGYADVELADDDDDVMAGQLAAGVQFAFSPHVAMDLGYRFMMTEDADLMGQDVEVRQHTALLGLQIRF